MRNTFAGASIHCFMASSACSGVTSFEMRMSQGNRVVEGAEGIVGGVEFGDMASGDPYTPGRNR